MAKTSFTTSNALTKKAWEEKLFRDTRKESYFQQWAGQGTDSIVQEKRQLEKQKGDKITFGIRMRLSGTGITSGTQLEGNEEKLSTYDYSVSLEQYRHGVRDNGDLDRQRAMFSIDDESETALKDWGGEKIDGLRFAALEAARSKVFYKTSGGVLFAAEATAKAALTTANGKLTLAMLSAVKAWTKTGGARTYIPMRPVKVKGKEYLIALMHPDILYDLKVTDTNWATAQREARERGSENPIFTGAAGVWDGIVLHEHESAGIAADGGGSSVPWGKVTIMGCQALLHAWCKAPKITAETFDYGNEHGYGIDMICGVGRPTFNSLEYGSVGLFCARTNISGL